jgi:hypothetical protein
VYVPKGQLDRAREVMNAEPMDEAALIEAEEEATQQLTAPKHGEGVETDA